MPNSRLSTINLMKKLASQNFNLGEVIFNGFDHIKQTEVIKLVQDNEEDTDSINQLDIWADMAIKYNGEPPDSYRVLNSMIMDWVDENENKLKLAININLREFLTSNYPDLDASDLNEDLDDYIWEDQVDYYPEIDEENSLIHFSLELVLDLEDESENDEEDEEDEQVEQEEV
jgi:hypothetical protein